MKKYEEPKVKLHELRAKTSMLQASGIVNQSKTFSSETTQSGDNEEPATQGFSTRNAW
jgi:hypothetical protein